MSPRPETRPPALERGRLPIRVLLLSTVYPNRALPTHGGFVRDRLLALPPNFETRVIAPAPWFPLVGGLRPGWRPSLPARELRDGLVVDHPRFLSVPGLLKSADAASLALTLLPRLRRLRASFPFDVIDAHFAYPEGVAAVLLGRWLRLPVVVTLRGSLPILAQYRLRRPQIAWALRRADRVIAVAESLRREATRLGRPAHRIRVVANGIDPELFHPLDRRESRRELGLPEDATILLGVGHLSRRKGFDLAIGAVARLLPIHPDARLVLVGGAGVEGAAKLDLQLEAQRQGVADRVVFAGPQPRERLATYYSAADLMVLPSELEGCPNVVLESIACGTPVVATPAGSVPEILADSDAGIVATPRTAAGVAGAAIQALARDWDRDRLRAWSLRRTWAAVGAETAEELRAAVVGRRQGGGPRLELAASHPTGGFASRHPDEDLPPLADATREVG